LLAKGTNPYDVILILLALVNHILELSLIRFDLLEVVDRWFVLYSEDHFTALAMIEM